MRTIDVELFDKTGTLSKGGPELKDVAGAGPMGLLTVTLPFIYKPYAVTLYGRRRLQTQRPVAVGQLSAEPWPGPKD